MNVLVLPSYYPNPDSPVSGLFVQEHIRAAMLNEELDMRVLFGRIIDGDSSMSISPWDTEEYGIRIRRWTVQRKNSFFAKVFGIRKYIRHGFELLRELHKKWKIDLVHVQESYPACGISLKAKKKLGIPYVITQHFGPFTKLINSFGKGGMVRKAMSHAQCIFCVSSTQQKELEAENIQGPFEIIANPVDTNFFRPENRPKKEEPFLFVGGLNDRKGVNILIEAIAQTKQNGVVHEVDIVGSGPNENSLRQLVKDKRVEDLVTFKGRVSHEKKLELLQDCKALVLPSYHENFGCVLTEAMSCGKPVVTTRCGGPTDFVNDENGRLCESGDVDALAELLGDVKTSNFDGDSIRSFVDENYSFAAIGKRFMTAYEKYR